MPDMRVTSPFTIMVRLSVPFSTFHSLHNILTIYASNAVSDSFSNDNDMSINLGSSIELRLAGGGDVEYGERTPNDKDDSD